MRSRLEESNSMITDEKERNIITDMEELCIMDKSERNIITDIEELNISERDIITDMEELNISERNIITDMKKQKCEGEDHVSSVTILVQIFISKIGVVYRNRTFVPSVGMKA
ncbi:hypothetical protein RhiirC2_783536 [Rhizophagus irregularis]|uniref:Uncharacterized protein n=1 Tax=Rhizophagus irregularis TaxID=588596 RepID=A0A2N1N0G5_9GLOM|nr:hypothetical protein RhiirC2_783536 [Rhizophagus irregularis]